MPYAHEDNVLATYRFLRVAMVPLLFILLVSVALETTRGPDCLLGSISAYFHTPVRGAFVGALFALGACLIAYKGNDALEEVLLNFAGFMAFLVALVPTTVDNTCVAKYGRITADANTPDAVRNNVTTLLLMSVAALALRWWIPRRVAARKRRLGLEVAPTAPAPRTRDGEKVRALARKAAWACGLIVVAELVAFWAFPDVFRNYAHTISAVTMVLGVLGVMLANARGYAQASTGLDEVPVRHWRNRYSAVAGVTVVLMLGAIAFARGTYLVLVLEVVVIVGFAVFWVLQTSELWEYPTRDEKSQKVDELIEERGPVPAPTEPHGSGRDRGLEPEDREVPGGAPAPPPTPAQVPDRGDVYKSI